MDGTDMMNEINNPWSHILLGQQCANENNNNSNHTVIDRNPSESKNSNNNNKNGRDSPEGSFLRRPNEATATAVSNSYATAVGRFRGNQVDSIFRLSQPETSSASVAIRTARSESSTMALTTKPLRCISEDAGGFTVESNDPPVIPRRNLSEAFDELYSDQPVAPVESLSSFTPASKQVGTNQGKNTTLISPAGVADLDVEAAVSASGASTSSSSFPSSTSSSQQQQRRLLLHHLHLLLLPRNL